MLDKMAAVMVHCKKKVSDFPAPSWDVTKQTLPGRKYIVKFFPARESLVSDIPAGDGKIANLFLQCRENLWRKPTWRMPCKMAANMVAENVG